MRKKRTLVVAIAAAVLMAMAVPTATGRGKPVKEKVAVAMSYDGAGIATSCQQPALMMNQDGKGMLRADWPANTDVEMFFPMTWSRNYPEPTGDVYPFAGCHGDRVEGSDEDGFGGYFILAPGPDGTVDLASRFDYYWEYECEIVRKGKNEREECTQKVLELFEINANLASESGSFDFSPSGQAQTVTGELELRRFEKLYGDGAWVTVGTVDIRMDITLGS